MTTAQYGADGCTCRPFTRHADPPRYLKPGEPTDRTTSWQQTADCPHHAPEAEYDDTSDQTRQDAIGRLLAFCDDIATDTQWRPVGPEVACRIRSLITGETDPPADNGPSVQEAAADDRRWFDSEKVGE